MRPLVSLTAPTKQSKAAILFSKSVTPTGQNIHSSPKLDAYPYDILVVNGRTTHISDLIAGNYVAADDAETALALFIQQWADGQENFILSTSGSTGSPKAITITRQQMISSARRTQEALGLMKGNAALVCLHPDYIAGKMMLVRCFVIGMKILFVSPSANPFQHVGDHQIDFCAFVPLQLHDILLSPDKELLRRIQVVIIGGGPINEETVTNIQGLECRCYATYGMTETVSHIALRLLNTAKATTYYEVLPEVALSLDERGCLVIDSPSLPQRVVTNDVVELLDDKRFNWLGRWDNVINTGGIKILPEQLEEKIAVLFREASIQNRFYLDSLPDPRLGSKIVMIVEGSASLDAVSSSMLPLRLAEPYAYPKLILFIPGFIEAANGKINRNATTIHAFHASGSGHSSV